ncbi:MAG: methicillin resistance protein, partial [Crocinitomicaceae bacterium]|nr:methicillin resistance protein [Crocinitomicaceae bacterium]
MEDNKTYYNKFCKKNELPIFFQPWWLDSTAGKNNWGVAIYEKSNEVFGVLPFFFKNKAIFKFLGLPIFSQHLGPWLIYPKGQKNNTKLAFEKEVLTNLINLLPKANVSVLKAHHSIQNILPFVWKGFDSTVKYTYLLKDILNNEAGLLENLSSGTRKNIKKAQKIVEVIESEDASELFGLIQKTFNRQRMKVPFNEAQLLNLYNSCIEKNSCKILLAKDKQNNIHSGILLIWNNKTVYYLMGGSNPNFRNSEAMSLVMWESIKFASSFAKEFDFEGTMVESIERFIRGFG